MRRSRRIAPRSSILNPPVFSSWWWTWVLMIPVGISQIFSLPFGTEVILTLVTIGGIFGLHSACVIIKVVDRNRARRRLIASICGREGAGKVRR